MRIHSLIGFLIGGNCVSGDILSIDFGSQFTKVALVSTGKFEIVHNLQSKRKTPSSVSFKSALREFGDDAVLGSVKSPTKVASFFRWLVGANLTTASDALSLYPHEYVPSFEVSVNETRKSILFGNKDFGQRAIEEVLAHLIWYSKNLVEEHDTVSSGKHKIGSLKDLVITVPSWATKRERQAIMDAAHIANMPRVTLVHETSSATVQRALDLELKADSPGPINTIYFNMGSSHFEACIVAYGLVVNSTSVPYAKVLGCSNTLLGGGIEITKRIAQKGLQKFVEKNPKKSDSFKSDFASKVRLFRQAENTKITLSANKETVYSVESIFDEIDLKLPITRSDIEEFAKPVLTEIESTIQSVLVKSGGMSMYDIHQAEVIGGGWRVPCVQTRLEQLVAPLPLGQHLNGDESMVFGGAYIAANSSSSFRVRKVVFTDISENEYSLEINPRSPIVDEASGKWPKTQTVFNQGHKLNANKQIKLNSLSSDFDVSVFENGNLIESFLVSGLDKVPTNTTSPPSISVKVKLDANGIFSVTGADASFEILVEEEKRVPRNVTTEPPQENETNSTSPPKVEYDTVKVEVVKKQKIALNLETVFEATPLPMSPEELKAIKSKMREISDVENKIKLRTKTKNDLETMIYSLRDRMEDDKVVLAHSTEDERNTVVQATKQAEEWLDETGYKADIDALKEQLLALTVSMKPIQDKIDEVRRQKEAEELAARLKIEEEARIAAEAEAAAAAAEKAKEAASTANDTPTDESLPQEPSSEEPSSDGPSSEEPSSEEPPQDASEEESEPDITEASESSDNEEL